MVLFRDLLKEKGKRFCWDANLDSLFEKSKTIVIPQVQRMVLSPSNFTEQFVHRLTGARMASDSCSNNSTAAVRSRRLFTATWAIGIGDCRRRSADTGLCAGTEPNVCAGLHEPRSSGRSQTASEYLRPVARQHKKSDSRKSSETQVHQKARPRTRPRGPGGLGRGCRVTVPREFMQCRCLLEHARLLQGNVHQCPAPPAH